VGVGGLHAPPKPQADLERPFPSNVAGASQAYGARRCLGDGWLGWKEPRAGHSRLLVWPEGDPGAALVVRSSLLCPKLEPRDLIHPLRSSLVLLLRRAYALTSEVREYAAPLADRLLFAVRPATGSVAQMHN
jgi:hypothetical protein